MSQDDAGLAVCGYARQQSAACSCMQAGGNLPSLTIGHELHDKPRVGDVGAAHLSATHALTHLGYHARHLICRKRVQQS